MNSATCSPTEIVPAPEMSEVPTGTTTGPTPSIATTEVPPETALSATDAVDSPEDSPPPTTSNPAVVLAYWIYRLMSDRGVDREKTYAAAIAAASQVDRSAALKSARRILGTLPHPVQQVIRVHAERRERVRASRASAHPPDEYSVQTRPARSRWSRSERSKTLAVVEEAVNDVLRNDHIARLVTDRRFRELPKHLRRPEVRAGVLTVADAKTTVGAIYIRSFLEVTPPEVVVRSVHVATAHRQKLGLRTSYPFPLGWDLTAGSGTVRRVVGAMGGNVVASDLTPVFDQVRLDARDIGKARHHREPLVRRARTSQEEFVPGLDRDTVSIDRPHVIFIDPPSRGLPTHQDLYGGGPPAPQDRGRDLAERERADWALVVGGIAVLALGYVAQGGAVSLLLREGRRDREHTFPEEGIADEVLGFVRERVPDVVVLDDLRVLYDPACTCNQRTLGMSRLPMRHVVLAKGRKL